MKHTSISLAQDACLVSVDHFIVGPGLPEQVVGALNITIFDKQLSKVVDKITLGCVTLLNQVGTQFLPVADMPR